MSDWTLDHVVIAGTDLEQEMKDFEQNLLVKPTVGGSDPTHGTRNALIGVKDSKTYIELLCPDPGKENCLGNQMLTRHGSGLALTPYHYAIRTLDLEAVQRKATKLGMQPTEIQKMSRTTSDGKILKYRVLFIRGHKLGGLVPYFIDWGSTPHPAKTLNKGSEPGSLCLSVKVVVVGPSDVLSKVKSLVEGIDGFDFEEYETPGVYFLIGIGGAMEGGVVAIKGFQPESVDFEESKARLFYWNTF